MSVIELIEAQKKLAERWKIRAQKLRERATALPEREMLGRETLLSHAQGIEECANDLELSIFFNEKKLEALLGSEQIGKRHL